MRKVLYLLGQLNDEDASWLAQVGRKRKLEDSMVLIREGESVQYLYVVLDGRLVVEITDVGSVAELGVGEVVGEISFVDSAPPSATVTALGLVVVLEISKATLLQRLNSDDGFAHRFYKAIALFLADRLRGTVARLGYGETGTLNSSTPLADELDTSLLDNISMAGDRFKRMLEVLHRAPMGRE